MKQLIILILIFHYSLTASSATVYFHFCHGEAQSISFDKQDASKQECPLCKENKSYHKQSSTTKASEEDGCKNVSLDLKKVDDNHFFKDNAKISPSISPAILVLHWIVLNQLYFENIDHSKYVLSSNIPISESNISPYLINCNFRI
ncbi:hypothetical protein LZQ00_12960 [Sphingobacterium sp. SRCM116780]|uniref:hypothetical protein n=1 Tax=Sphingobacterium sp. SRCM116780 TaxID=2907623 RepID=UPI001F44C806|nr:hypothetical protein [Sphingobacterium sp. SRCM116780]UIR55179.1 hypothetical protein LZQ00_12960 [Sphingobacterium sp. SRCM116780]